MRALALVALSLAMLGGASAIIHGQSAQAASTVTTKETLEHLAHVTGDKGAAMHLAGSGVSMGDDIGNFPWLGGICHTAGLVRCCYLSATGKFGRCKCYCNAGGCNWGFALPGE